MALENWTAEGGVNATAVTNGSSGGTSGTAFAMSTSALVTCTFLAAAAINGGMGIRWERTATGGKGYAQRVLASPGPRGLNRGYVKLSGGVPTNTVAIEQMLDNSGTALVVGTL